MSNKAIIVAMESRLNSIVPALPIAWENTNFKPVANQPYQEANILFAKPENPTFGDDFYRQRGYLQVKLHYPLNKGKKDIIERAELIREWFNRGLSLEAFGIVTTIEETPEITNGEPEGSMFSVIVRIRFFANIGVDVASIPAPPIPLPGDNDNEFLIERTAGENIGALKAIVLDINGTAFISDKDDASVDATIGISVVGGLATQLVSIQVGGELTDNSWNWNTGAIYLGDNGNLTQVVPNTGSIFKLGVAIGPISMIIEPQLIALLGS